MSVVVRAVGLASPLGLGRAATMAGWNAGRSGLVANPIPTEGRLRGDAGVVPGFDPRTHLPDRKAVKLMSREAQLLVFAAVEAAGGTHAPARLGVDPVRFGAFAASGYEVTPLDEVLPMFRASRSPTDPRRIDLGQLFSAGRDAYNPLSPLKTLPNMALFHAGSALGLEGPFLALGSSPAAGIAALAGAVDALVDRTVDAVFVGGTDAPLEVFRLHYLVECGVLDGAAPGEGAAALLLARDGDGPRIAAVALGQEPPAGPEPSAHYGRICDGGATRRALYQSVLLQALREGAPIPDLAILDLWGAPDRDEAERNAVVAALDAVGSVDRGLPLLATRPQVGHLGAAHGLFDVALAVEILRAGGARCVLVTASGGAGDLGAVVLWDGGRP